MYRHFEAEEPGEAFFAYLDLVGCQAMQRLYDDPATARRTLAVVRDGLISQAGGTS